MYKLRNDLTTSDTAFEIEAKSLNELFSDAGKALITIQIKKADKNDTIKSLHLNKAQLLDLFYDFLSQLLFLKDTELFFAKEFEINVFQKDNQWFLEAEIIGGCYQQDPETFGTDVKAITYHELKIEKENDSWKAIVVVDV